MAATADVTRRRGIAGLRVGREADKQVDPGDFSPAAITLGYGPGDRREQAMATLYERDFYSWAMQQAEALRLAAGARINTPAVLDWENLAEEIESLGKSQASELDSRYTQLLAHLLKWMYQPSKWSKSWRRTIDRQRIRIDKLLRQNSGLQSRQIEIFREAYVDARKFAASETGLDRSVFPPASPWTLAQATDEDFWPEAPSPQ